MTCVIPWIGIGQFQNLNYLREVVFFLRGCIYSYDLKYILNL
jgi:hypothetical protein